MKLLIIGSDGQLGFEFLAKADVYNYQVIALNHKDIDIEDEKIMIRVLDEHDFDVIINTTAYHGKKAYSDKNPKKHFNINSFGPFYLARYCEKRDKIFVHYSTDYIFSGNKSRSNYFFIESDNPNPSNLYGSSKLAGEILIRTVNCRSIIIRVASLFGHRGCKAKGYDNFVEMIIRKYENGESLKVVNDIYMTPTNTEIAVDTTIKLIEGNHFGLFHLVSSGNCNWFEFAKEIFTINNFDEKNLISCASSQKEQTIDRGLNTSLSNKKILALDIDIPNWKKLLVNYLNKRKENDFIKQ